MPSDRVDTCRSVSPEAASKRSMIIPSVTSRLRSTHSSRNSGCTGSDISTCSAPPIHTVRSPTELSSHRSSSCASASSPASVLRYRDTPTYLSVGYSGSSSRAPETSPSPPPSAAPDGERGKAPLGPAASLEKDTAEQGECGDSASTNACSRAFTRAAAASAAEASAAALAAAATATSGAPGWRRVRWRAVGLHTSKKPQFRPRTRRMSWPPRMQFQADSHLTRCDDRSKPAAADDGLVCACGTVGAAGAAGTPKKFSPAVPPLPSMGRRTNPGRAGPGVPPSSDEQLSSASLSAPPPTPSDFGGEPTSSGSTAERKSCWMLCGSAGRLLGSVRGAAGAGSESRERRPRSVTRGVAEIHGAGLRMGMRYDGDDSHPSIRSADDTCADVWNTFGKHAQGSAEAAAAAADDASAAVLASPW
eukprot:Rhum_TRINITY_DN14861_c13_g1::Rhum_TRINITY_DN14861_c13_g1_i1::g.124356::m.124356